MQKQSIKSVVLSMLEAAKIGAKIIAKNLTVPLLCQHFGFGVAERRRQTNL
jgi:hypothetical protein